MENVTATYVGMENECLGKLRGLSCTDYVKHFVPQCVYIGRRWYEIRLYAPCVTVVNPLHLLQQTISLDFYTTYFIKSNLSHYNINLDTGC